MSNSAAWLLLSFAIMVIAALVTLYEKFEELEKRLNRLEGGREPGEDGNPALAGSNAREGFRRSDHHA